MVVALLDSRAGSVGVQAKIKGALKSLLFLSLLSFFACKTDETSKQAVPGPISDTSIHVLEEETEGPSTPPVAYAAPPLDSGRVFVQSTSFNAINQTAAVTGLSGAAAAGVTEICAENISNSPATITCFPADPINGSFLGVLENTNPKDHVLLWGNGPTFAQGGPGINSIEEEVQYFSARYPMTVYDMLLTQEGLYLAAYDGLYLVAKGDLSKPVADIFPQKFTERDGLPSNAIGTIVSDENGGLWIATMQHGLYPKKGLTHLRVDSNGKKKLVIYSTAEGLLSDTIWTICSDKNGGVWIAYSFDGMSHLTLDSLGQPRLTHFTPANGLPFSQISSLAPDGNNGVWIGGGRAPQWLFRNGGLTHLSIDSSGTPTYSTYSTANGLPSDNVTSVLAISTDEVWVGTYDKGMSHVRVSPNGLATFTNYSYDPWNPNSLIYYGVNYISTDGSGGIFASCGMGLSHLTFDSSGLPQFRNYRQADGLPSDGTFSVISDENGGAWIGTYGYGASHLKLPSEQFTNYNTYVVADSFRENIVSAMASDGNGGAWVGSFSSGLAHLTFDSMGTAHVRNYSTVDGLPGNSITSLVADDRGGVWIGTERAVGHLWYDASGAQQISIYDASTGVNGYFILAIATDDNGGLWISTNAGLNHLTIQAGQPHYDFYGIDTGSVITADGAGGLWFSGYLAVGHLTIVSGQPQVATYDFNAYGIGSAGIRSIALDPSSDIVWFGGNGGLVQMTLDTSGVPQYTIYQFDASNPNSLQSFIITSLLPDGAGGVWIGGEPVAFAPGGLSHLTFDSASAPHFENIRGGMPSNSVLTLAVRHGGGLWVGTGNGVVLVNP